MRITLYIVSSFLFLVLFTIVGQLGYPNWPIVFFLWIAHLLIKKFVPKKEKPRM